MNEQEIKKNVRAGYAKIAKQGGSCCAPANTCCGGTSVAAKIVTKIGYDEKELRSIPEGANLGLGCGNPVALASLHEGETVLDLGSGAGIDCFLAADKVGASGRVIGVDMTPEMIERARENARNGDYENVEFRLGEIESLPVADGSVDAVISNCVINLSPDKKKVFAEAFRALKPGGRLMVSDIVLLKKLPDAVMNSVEAYIGCVAGAIMKDEYLEVVRAAGFRDVRVVHESTYPADYFERDTAVGALLEKYDISLESTREAAGSVASIKVYGVKRR